jgi:regulatory protein
MPFDEASQRVYSYLLNILNKKEYSTQEMRTKALKKEFDPKLIEIEIQGLLDKNWLNDKRLAENILDYYRDQRGLNWITQKMKTRLLPHDLIDEVINTFKDSDQPQEFDSIKLMATRKYKVTDWSAIDIKVQNKVIWFLQYRGYSNAFELINSWKHSEN